MGSGRAAVTLGTLVAAASGVMARPLRGRAEALAVMARAVWVRPLVVINEALVVMVGTLLAGALPPTAAALMHAGLAVMARTVWARPLVVMGGWGTGPT
ncbi:hypothetical protein ACFY05_28275 [Microtetraspora fusca]|uniref:Uncharacterized protein n=1 Tax=Microtetraspora fusca TaxID=1997 RepID=A0ABW6VBP0_MICFU